MDPATNDPWDRITVVLVTRNSGAILPTSLGSLPNAKRIILVDALSTDNTTAVAKECHPAVEVISLTEDHGLGAATNIGFALAKTEYVLNINPDTRRGGSHRQGIRQPLSKGIAIGFVVAASEEVSDQPGQGQGGGSFSQGRFALGKKIRGRK